MAYRLLLIILISFSIIASCTSEKEPETDLSSLPEEIQRLENLIVLKNDPKYSISIADSQNYGEVYLSLSPAAPSRGVGPKNAVDSNGNVFRYNYSESALQMFNNDGTLISEIGRKGRGPGEFQQIAALDARDGTLMVYDAGLTRVSLFDIESQQLEKSIAIPFESWDVKEAKYLFPKTFLLDSDGDFITAIDTEKEEGSSYFSFYKVNQEGNIASSKIVETQSLARHSGQTKMGHNAGISLPFSTQGKIAISEMGDIYHINTEEFLIRKFNKEGNLEQAFYMPFQKDPLEEQEVLDQYHPNMHPVFDDVEYPKTWPALHQIFMDSENRIWVSAIVDNHTIYKWFVIEEEGVLATLDWPKERKVVAIRNGKLYTERLDLEAGMRVMTGYTLNFNKQE